MSVGKCCMAGAGGGGGTTVCTVCVWLQVEGGRVNGKAV